MRLLPLRVTTILCAAAFDATTFDATLQGMLQDARSVGPQAAVRRPRSNPHPHPESSLSPSLSLGLSLSPSLSLSLSLSLGHTPSLSLSLTTPR